MPNEPATDPAQHHPHLPQRPHTIHPNLILAVLCAAGLAYAVLSSAVIPALPTFQHELHTSETGATWLLTAFLLSASSVPSESRQRPESLDKE